MKLLRGRVIIRETPLLGSLWTPDGNPRDRKTHTGRVLAMGPPAFSSMHAVAREVELGFQVGDLVQYHFEFNEQVSLNIWKDGKPAHWIPQQDVDGVWEETDGLHA